MDEIGDMPLDLQGHLLRVIEERKIVRIGGHDLIPINVRIIAATNRNLSEEVASGRFRQDLYYRLNVLSIHMLPLRERLADLPLLVLRFYEKLARSCGQEVLPVSKEFMDVLTHYSYPGNIRELQNIIERTLVLSENGSLLIANLPAEVMQASREGSAALPGSNMRSGGGESDPERDALYHLLLKNRGISAKPPRSWGWHAVHYTGG